jgi:hypothetical protein
MPCVAHNSGGMPESHGKVRSSRSSFERVTRKRAEKGTTWTLGSCLGVALLWLQKPACTCDVRCSVH